jgi:hypothetical protein
VIDRLEREYAERLGTREHERLKWSLRRLSERQTLGRKDGSDEFSAGGLS